VADAALAGLPRLVRVVEEVRMRGVAALGIGTAAAGWWMLAYLIDQDVSVLKTLVAGGAVGVVTLVIAAVASSRRLSGAGEVRRPPSNAVYETIADGRERRVRLAGIVVFGVIVLLAFDRLTGGDGEMAGLVAGLFLPVGAVDVLEARSWAALERMREDSMGLYVLVRPQALMASMARHEVYERPRGDRQESLPSPFDL